MYSSFLSTPAPLLMDISPRISWCANETVRSSYVMLDFTQSLYLLYATVYRHLELMGSNISIMYANSSHHRVPYMTVDGVTVRHAYNYIVQVHAYIHMYFIELQTRTSKWPRDYYLIVDTHQHYQIRTSCKLYSYCYQ